MAYWLVGSLFFCLLFDVWIGFVLGIIAGVVWTWRGHYRTITTDIQCLESLTWSWLSAGKGGFYGFVLGTILPVVLLFLSDLNEGSSHFEALPAVLVLSALFFGTIFGLFGSFFSGLKRGVLDNKTTLNSGIRMSIRHFILVTVAGLYLIIGPLIGLIVGSSRLPYRDGLR